jgi:D-alanine transaminase
LPGICRATALRLAEAAQIRVDQRAFNLDELFAADEAFLTSTTAPLLSIVRVDGRTIGTGAPGPVTRRLAELMWDEIARQTGYDPRRLA